MDCRFAQKELGAGSEVSPEVQRHVESCGECRAFAEEVRVFRFLSESTVATPAALKERTLDGCRTILAENTAKRREPLWQRWHRLKDSPQFVVAAATLGMLILTTVAVLQIDGAQDENASLLIRVTIIQFGVQNLAAALFLPALLLLKSRLGARPERAAEIGA